MMYTTGLMGVALKEQLINRVFQDGYIKEILHPELNRIYILKTRDEAATFVAEKMLQLVSQKPDAAITLPSSSQGNSVLEKVVMLAKQRNISFDKVHFFHLDEYFPISADHKDSFRNNLRKTIFEPLDIPKEHIHEIGADPGIDGDEAALAYEQELAQYEIDLVLHPIGPDGHMAFAEAGTPRDSRTHVATLSQKTVYRDRVLRNLSTPDHAITQGIATILNAKKILFIDFSLDYAHDLHNALYGPITEENPSSLLRTVGHKVELVTTQEVAKAAGIV